MNSPNPDHDPWVVQEKPNAALLPVGTYVATFGGVEDYKLPPGGELKWRWKWVVISPAEHKGRTASALTDCKIHPSSPAGRLIVGLLGRQIQPGEIVKALIDGCVGKDYMIQIQLGPMGGKPQVRFVCIPPKL